MGWLPIYKIGKALLESGKYKADLPYYASYHQGKKKEVYVLELIINLKTSNISLNAKKCDGYSSKLEKEDHPFRREGFFTNIAGNFTGYYLCPPYYSAEKNLLDFFGIKDGKLVLPKKAKGLIGFEKEYENLIKEKRLNEDFRLSRLVNVRRRVRKNTIIVNKLTQYLANLKLVVELAKEKKFNEMVENQEIDLIPLNPRINLSKTEDDVIYVIPKIIDEENPKGFYLNQEKEAKAFYYNRFLKEGNIIETKKSSEYCHFSGESEVYSVKFPRDNVNLLKVNVQQTVNYKSNFVGETLLLSRKAYECLKLGAWFVDKRLNINIAGIRHYVLPEFHSNFDIQRYRYEVSEKLDFAFSPKDFEKMKQRLYRLNKGAVKSLSFIGYISDGRQIDLVNRIQLVQPDHFNTVFDTFYKKTEILADISDKNFLQRLPFQAIQYLFPVFSDNIKKKDVLVFMKLLLENKPIDKNLLLSNFSSLIQIYKYRKKDSKGNFSGTVNIRYPKSENGKKIEYDDLISFATIKYQVLFNVINLIFNKMDLQNDSSLNKTEQYFLACGLSESQKAMFFLGRLIRRVAEAQNKQGNAKAILDKINYSGMSVQDIKWLVCEVIEKLKQYNKSQKTMDRGEHDLENFNRCFGLAEKSWGLSNIENVFYIFSGYGMYWATLKKPKEQEAVVED